MKRFDVAYFAASVDTAEKNAKFAQSLGLEFPILSDPTKATARAYGVLGPIGLASRWTFYIGADGRILDVDKHVNAGRHGEDVAAALKRLGVRSSGFGVRGSGVQGSPEPRTKNPEPGTPNPEPR